MSQMSLKQICLYLIYLSVVLYNLPLLKLLWVQMCEKTEHESVLKIPQVGYFLFLLNIWKLQISFLNVSVIKCVPFCFPTQDLQFDGMFSSLFNKYLFYFTLVNLTLGKSNSILISYCCDGLENKFTP